MSEVRAKEGTSEREENHMERNRDGHMHDFLQDSENTGLVGGEGQNYILYTSVKGSDNETGWDLKPGTWDSLLQCLHLGKHSLEQKDTKTL